MSRGAAQRTMDDYVDRTDEFMRDTFDWYSVAKKEFKDAIRSKGLWLLGFVFTAFFVFPPAGALYFDIPLGTGGSQDLGTELLISAVYTNIATVFVPIIAMFAGFNAITKERESGSLKLLLSLPHSRLDVVVGKVLGRIAVVGVPLAGAFAVTAVFLFIALATFKVGLYATFALYTLGLALVFVAIAVSISGAVHSTVWSIIANTVVYFYFTFGWNAVANAIAGGLKDYLGVSGAVRWHSTLMIKLLNPSQAYKTLTNSMLADGEGAALSARFGMFSQGNEVSKTICADVLNGAPKMQEGLFGEFVTCNPGGGGLPFFYSDPAVFVYLLLWIGVAALVSYKTFNLADL